VRSDKALFDTTNPAALGSVGPGTAVIAARRDHVHAMPSAANVGAAAASSFIAGAGALTGPAAPLTIGTAASAATGDFAPAALTAARIYYVRTDGNDSNTGLANTAGGAFRTVGKAVTVARSINLGSHHLTISVGAGTFVENTLYIGPYLTSGGALSITGAGSGTTVFSCADGNCITGDGHSVWYFNSMTFTASDGNGVEANQGIQIHLTDIGFASVSGSAVRCRRHAVVYLWGTCTFQGESEAFVYVNDASLVLCDLDSLTLSGTCSFSDAFAFITGISYFIFAGSITGSATGTRYVVSLNSVLDTDGAGSTYLPGNGAGSTATGGLYL
jgi:hypothetical protein